jgi:predicted transcriptional regulator
VKTLERLVSHYPTHSAAAAALNMSASSLSRYLSGERKPRDIYRVAGVRALIARLVDANKKDALVFKGKAK